MGVRRRVYGWETAGGAEQHFRIDLPWLAMGYDGERFELSRGGQPNHNGFDVVFAHRLAGHQPRWHELCDDPAKLCIYDMDDDILNIDPSNTLPYHVFHPLEAETRRNVEHADIITVSSEGLRQRYEKINPRTYLLPMVIPDDMPWYGHTPSRYWQVGCVGWAGSMHKAQDWAYDAIAEQLATLAELRPEVLFRTIGGDYTKGLLGGHHPPRHEHRPFTTLDNYYRGMDFNIGIAPLMPSPFNDGKTTTKLIEYGARGIPTIASAIGDYARWIDHGVNGLLVNEPGDWLTHLEFLCGDREARIRMSQMAWLAAREHRVSYMIHHWEEVFSMDKVAS